MVKVSVIIPTFNRYNLLLKAIDSAKKQTHKDVEIIVINDGSTQEEYKEKKGIPEDIKWIDLNPTSKEKYGYPCPGYARNEGIKIATGDYIAFLDDDDHWKVGKIELQLKLMEDNKVKMCCSDAETKRGNYNGKVAHHHILKDTKMKSIPNIFNLDYIKKNNTIIFSSVIVEKSIIEKIGGFKEIDKNGGKGARKNKVFEDYEFSKACLQHTDCWYHRDPLLYYDL